MVKLKSISGETSEPCKGVTILGVRLTNLDSNYRIAIGCGIDFSCKGVSLSTSFISSFTKGAGSCTGISSACTGAIVTGSAFSYVTLRSKWLEGEVGCA